MSSCHYHRVGAALHPTELAHGPWAPGVQHGASVCGIVARAVEGVPTAVPMDLVRLTVDLSRRVPLGPTTVEAEVLRQGRRLQVVAATVLVDGEPRASGQALLVRREAVVEPAHLPAPWPGDVPAARPTGAEGGTETWPRLVVERMRPRFEEWEPGRGTVWLTLADPLVDGEPVTPGIRAAMAADMIMTAGDVLDRRRYSAVNADVSLHVVRPPVGTDVRLVSTVRVGDGGHGVAEGELHDVHGRFGSATKSLLVDRA